MSCDEVRDILSLNEAVYGRRRALEIHVGETRGKKSVAR